MLIKRLASTLFLLGGLVACSGGSEDLSTQTGIAKSVRETFQRPTPTPDIVLTREVIDQLPTATIEAYLESRDQTAYVVPFSIRSDVVIWAAGDGAQLVMRGGLVTATRGVGRDLASSDYAATLSALAQRSGTSNRRLFLRNDEGGQDQLTLRCETRDLGPATIEVVERAYNTRHVRESCRVGEGNVENDYWIEAKTGVIRQSRQWLGPALGHLRLRMLKQ